LFFSEQFNTMAQKEVHGFQTEVTKLLSLLAKSLYSNKDVFLRELISNASDAIDKLRFLAITKPELLGDDPNFAIRVKGDEKAGTLTISDNGVGMTLEQANEHLGTIAKSGTEEFLKNLTGEQKKDSQLIGQFGVGFYSSFIVADKVTVISRAAGAKPDEAVKWESEGQGTYTSEPATRETRGTDIILHLKPDCTEFLYGWKLREDITKYSDHISTPVYLWAEKLGEEKKGDEKKEPVWEWQQVNDARALWTLPPKDVKDDQYKAFYKHLTHEYDDPLCWAHNRVEGEPEYISLLYIPSVAPWDLYTRDKQHGLKLFVQRVFIMDDAEQFLPNYLRFVRGLVDTADLPLNVSRELLQESPVTAKLKKALTRRALDMIAKLAKDPEKYKVFWKEFGRVMKEGPVEDYANRDAILKLLRFASTKSGTSEENVSLEDYVSRMNPKQKNIYYLTASTYEAAAGSPYLETFRRKGIEVLFMTSRIDEWMMQSVTEFDGKPFVPVTAKDLQLGELEDKEETAKQEAAAKESAPLVERFKKALGDKVSDVRVSSRLTDSPSCVVGQTDRMMTAQMRRMLEAAGQQVPEEKYALEINPGHELVKKAAAETDDARFAKWADFIYEEARLADQGSLKDPGAFVKLMNELLLK
jgi:molecular chaperone HtpG